MNQMCEHTFEPSAMQWLQKLLKGCLKLMLCHAPTWSEILRNRCLVNKADGHVAYLGGLDAVHGLEGSLCQKYNSISGLKSLQRAFNVMMAQNHSEFCGVLRAFSDITPNDGHQMQDCQ